MSKPKVIGVYHDSRHPDFPSVINYLEREIQRDAIVAIESPWQLERILLETTNALPEYQFLYNVCSLVQKRGGHVRPVEDMALYTEQAGLCRLYMSEFDGNARIENDERYQELHILRSMRLLELAKEENSDFLISGIIHAYDLLKMKYNPVELLSVISEKIRRQEDLWIKKWGKPLLI